MDDQLTTSEIPQYSVSVWEIILIVIAALTLIGVGLVGLGIKVLNNAFDPIRAEAVARSLIDYKIPGGSQGVFGINIGVAKLAWVRSTTNPPDVVLFVGKTPINEETSKTDLFDLSVNPPSEDASQDFVATASRTDNKVFCGKKVSTIVEEGQQSFADSPDPVPAIRYIASTVQDEVEQVVVVTANGKNAATRIEQVFSSLKCK
ncbi:hypothetical protein K9N68_17650 [Kovacikia minuta CCNUW1]|uniref:hypothetical protein n=1 Tax=Kovacikia minuta TaxID=2931930 RepID=UPI001CCA72FA|nr:hypothetical protein [Kovacikia minuta]UBF23606.1 hypothetical protein K9N68_17650 [Kovacikia minuta CCNUW1]